MISSVDRGASVNLERIITNKAVRTAPVTPSARPQVSLQELVSILITHLFNLN